MSDTSGPSLPTPLAFYDPDSSSWRTSQDTFPWVPSPSLVTLPASGMTLAGRLYELPMSGPATAAPDSSSSLLPTPVVTDGAGARNATSGRKEGSRHHSGTTLSDFAMLLPTPSAADGLGGHERRGGDRGDELLLAGLVKDVTLLPTPAAWDGDRGPDYARMGREDSGGDDLVTSMARLLPTPTRRDHKGHNQRHDETCLTGALTAPPSPGTPPPSDELPPTLWTLEDDSRPSSSSG